MIPAITHTVHVKGGDGAITKYGGVLDVMVLPSGEAKFEHEGNITKKDGGSIIRTRVDGVGELSKYVCSACDDDASSLVTATDFGAELSGVDCPECDSDAGFERSEI